MISFKGASISINAMSDTHGMLENSGAAYQVIKDNKENMFVKEGKGKRNFLMLPGDCFMAGETVGYLSDPKACAQDFQLKFLNKFIALLKQNFAPNMQTFFTIGNHDADVGPEKLNQTIKNLDATTVVTNLDSAHSPAFQENFDSEKLVKSKVIKIEDDKIDGKIHRMLVVGLAPVNMSFYNKKTDMMTFIDDVKMPQNFLNQKDFQKTLKVIDDEVEAFKNDYPKGVVVLMSHCGAGVAERLMEKDKIDLILDGHTHENEEIDVKGDGTKYIIKLWENYMKIHNVKIEIDDYDNISINPKPYETDLSKNHNNEMADFYQNIFSADLNKLFSIKSTSGMFGCMPNRGARYANNYLANYVTDVIKHQIKEKDPSVEIFGLNATSLRAGLNTENSRPVNNLEVILVLNGLKEYSADIFTNEITGKELIKIIWENLKFNERNKDTNSLIQYSGLVINKALLDCEDIEKASFEELRKYVIFEGKPLDLERAYKVANVEKWLIKSEYSGIEKLRADAKLVKNANAKKLFRDYFEKYGDNAAKQPIIAKREVRIIERYPK